eukprot:13609791-Alexandrium_andersonii.AAC.1
MCPSRSPPLPRAPLAGAAVAGSSATAQWRFGAPATTSDAAVGCAPVLRHAATSCAAGLRTTPLPWQAGRPWQHELDP